MVKNMIKKGTILFFLLLLGLSLVCNQDAFAISWRESFKPALKDAKRLKKTLIVDFYTDWCGWCKKMDRETYSNKEVEKLAKEFICVKVNGDKEPGLVARYMIVSYPTIVFLDGEGMLKKRMRGFVEADQFQREMRLLLGKKAPSEKVSKKKERKKEKEKKKEGMPFELTGIVYDAHRPEAIINNTIVKIGDTIDGAKIVEITKHGVKLYYENRLIMLNSVDR